MKKSPWLNNIKTVDELESLFKCDEIPESNAEDCYSRVVTLPQQKHKLSLKIAIALVLCFISIPVARSVTKALYKLYNNDTPIFEINYNASEECPIYSHLPDEVFEIFNKDITKVRNLQDDDNSKTLVYMIKHNGILYEPIIERTSSQRLIKTDSWDDFKNLLCENGLKESQYLYDNYTPSLLQISYKSDIDTDDAIYKDLQSSLSKELEDIENGFAYKLIEVPNKLWNISVQSHKPDNPDYEMSFWISIGQMNWDSSSIDKIEKYKLNDHSNEEIMVMHDNILSRLTDGITKEYTTSEVIYADSTYTPLNEIINYILLSSVDDSIDERLKIIRDLK